jgi:hypothetical protein
VTASVLKLWVWAKAGEAANAKMKTKCGVLMLIYPT